MHPLDWEWVHQSAELDIRSLATTQNRLDDFRREQRQPQHAADIGCVARTDSLPIAFVGAVSTLPTRGDTLTGILYMAEQWDVACWSGKISDSRIAKTRRF